MKMWIFKITIVCTLMTKELLENAYGGKLSILPLTKHK